MCPCSAGSAFARHSPPAAVLGTEYGFERVHDSPPLVAHSTEATVLDDGSFGAETFSL